MSETSPPRKRQGFWLTIGEIVAVIGLLIAGLNYWTTREEQHTEARKSAAAARAAAALVVAGQADADGRRVTIHAINPSQAIQAQRYYFPHVVLAHPMEVAAAQPQINLAWIEGGLKHARELKNEGESTVPVAIVTTFVEDGETHTDMSLYRLGYAWGKSGLFGGVRLRLEGLALERRTAHGDPRKIVDAAWTQSPGAP